MLFENFGGRNRESMRILTHMQNIGVFDSLPNDTVRFIQKNYRTDVPYRNRINVLYGLLWLHHKGAPLLAKLGWAGHGAGHNGVKEESPEVLSAFLTWQWLKNHTGWLKERGIDPQDCTRIIDATRFPYAERTELDEIIQWVRWTDVIRTTSGDTAQYLSTEKTHPLCAYFFESAQVIREMEMPPNESDFRKWFSKVQPIFFKQIRNLITSDTLFLGAWETIEGFNELEKVLSYLRETINGDIILPRVYAFLSQDVTYPEFEDIFSPHFHSLKQ